MTSIKICGLTNAQDALRAAEMGADALGFIGVPGTPRYLTPEQFQHISKHLPLFIPRVIVVRQPTDAIEYGADWVQYYTDGSPEAMRREMATRRIRAFRMRDAASLCELRDYPYPLSAALLDAYHAEKLGGSGATFDWTLAAQARELTTCPVLLAGGLTPDNVCAALDAVRPDGVDVSSGVEAAPGVKDPAKLRAFIQMIRAWDEAHTSVGICKNKTPGATISNV